MARVAHIIPTDQIALRMKSRLQRIQEAGFELTVICGPSGFGDKLADCGFEVIHIPFAREIEPLTDLRCLLALRSVLARGRYDIVHSHNPKGTLLGTFAARLAQVPIAVHTVYGFLFRETTRGLYHILAWCLERWGALWSHHVFFQCQEDFTYARKHHWKRERFLHVIGGGIDERRFDRDEASVDRPAARAKLGFGEQHVVVGMVGRLVEEKGWIEFFQMARRISLEFDHARFLAIGIVETDQSDSLDPRTLIAECDLTDRVVLLEDQSDMPELYSCMDIAVLPSHREGIPRALSEAGAMGAAMVASNIRGCREVITHEETGLLFPLEDVDALTESVRRLLMDGHLLQRLAKAGRQSVIQEHTEGLSCARVTECYRMLLDAQTVDNPERLD